MGLANIVVGRAVGAPGRRPRLVGVVTAAPAPSPVRPALNKMFLEVFLRPSVGVGDGGACVSFHFLLFLRAKKGLYMQNTF